MIAWFANNSVAANLLMAGLLVGGTLSLLRMNAEVLPEIDPRILTVSVDYAGATPAEVEDAITRRVEDAVMGLEGVDRVTSTAVEGLGTVNIELEDFVDAQSVKDDVRSALDRLANFPPEDASDARVVMSKSISAVLRLIVTGDVGEQSLKRTALSLRRGLLSQEGVSLVTLQGARDYEVSIEVSEADLRAYGLRIDQVAAAIRLASVNLSLGQVRTSGGEILLRTNSEARDTAALAEIVVLSDQTGQRVRLGEITSIRDGFEDAPLHNTYNGKPSIFLQVDRSGDEDAFAVKAAVSEFLQRYRPPPGVSVLAVSDTTEVIGDRINLLARNAIMGLALVFVFLALCLDLRLAFWTSFGIPSAFLGGFILFGDLTTINMTSLLGLIMVLGIVVDDAIVVGESIHEKQARFGSGVRTAIAGAQSVFAPVLVGVVTSMLAFATLLQSAGTLGQLLRPVPIVVLSVLFVSLVEAFLVLPSHLAHGRDWSKGAMLRLKGAVQAGMDEVRDRVFIPMVRWSVRFPYAVLAAGVALLIAVAGIVAGGHIRFIFFPAIEGDEVKVALEMPAGTPFAQTEAAMQRVVDALPAALGDDNIGVYRSLSVTVGGRLSSGFGARGTELSSEIATAILELAPAEERALSSAEVERRWREAVGRIPGVKSLSFDSAGGPASSADVSFNLSHPDDAALLAAVQRLADAMRRLDGVNEVESSAEPGKRQLEFALTPAGTAAGLTVDELARSIRRSYFGEEVQRFQRDSEEVTIFVRFPEAERRSLSDLARMRIRLPNGDEVPLSVVASVSESRGFVSIDRTSGQRVVTVSADVDEAVTTPNAVSGLLEQGVVAELLAADPNLLVSLEGQARSQAEELRVLLQNFLFAALAIYVLIASVLRSYLQPFVIMAIIPFGFVGAVLGHLLLGYDLTFLSLFGVVALAGVIINDSIVLIDYFNLLEQRGGNRIDNIVESVRRRFRPIVITTLTTFIGLLPMVSETSLQAQFLIPMAVSLSFGILFASGLILLLVPACLALAKGSPVGQERRPVSV